MLRKLTMVLDDKLSVKSVSEDTKKTPKFPSRERNRAVRRRVKKTNGFLRDTVSLSAISFDACDDNSQHPANDCDEPGCRTCLIRSHSL